MSSKAIPRRISSGERRLIYFEVPASRAEQGHDKGQGEKSVHESQGKSDQRKARKAERKAREAKDRDAELAGLEDRMQEAIEEPTFEQKQLKKTLSNKAQDAMKVIDARIRAGQLPDSAMLQALHEVLVATKHAVSKKALNGKQFLRVLGVLGLKTDTPSVPAFSSPDGTRYQLLVDNEDHFILSRLDKNGVGTPVVRSNSGSKGKGTEDDRAM